PPAGRTPASSSAEPGVLSRGGAASEGADTVDMAVSPSGPRASAAFYTVWGRSAATAFQFTQRGLVVLWGVEGPQALEVRVDVAQFLCRDHARRHALEEEERSQPALAQQSRHRVEDA